jgi:RHS repeat-associated protein
VTDAIRKYPSSPALLLDLRYLDPSNGQPGYDEVGNLEFIQDFVMGSPQVQSFEYTHDAENRLVSVSWAIGSTNHSMTFVFDGDGSRVRSTLDGTTTTFAGTHYEVTGSAITKYYYSGTSRIAMRSSIGLRYIFGDHPSTSLRTCLGSASVTADGNGSSVTRQLYKPYGETRSSGSVPTKYTFTGQYSYSIEIGLMYYVARFYDPLLGRFVSADTIVPQPGSLLAWDRYMFVLGNPLKYTDPSGHEICYEDGYCIQKGATEDEIVSGWAAYYGVTFISEKGTSWTYRNKKAALTAVMAVGSAFSNVFGYEISSADAFLQVYGLMDFEWVNSYVVNEIEYTTGAVAVDSHHIKWASMSQETISQPGGIRTEHMAFVDARNNVVHELGHAFAYHWSASIPGSDGEAIPNPAHPYNVFPGSFLTDQPDSWPVSPTSAGLTWRQHPSRFDNGVSSRGEVFADMFLGWTFNKWGSGEIGSQRRDFMTTNMVEWLK